MTHIVMGVDGGGTKTECVLLDEAQRELGRGLGGPSNQYNIGLECAMQAVQAAMANAMRAAGLVDFVPDALCLSMAGADLPADVAQWQQAARALLPAGVIEVYNDAEGALVGGIGRPYGVVLIAGTGSIAFGINARGASYRVNGWGHVYGDEGSAYWIGLQALRAVLRAHDGRGPATHLSQAVCAQRQAARVEALIEQLFLTDFGVAETAALAPVVAATAQAGDAPARGILQHAGEELGLSASAVIRALGMQGEAFEIALVGGVFHAGELLLRSLRQALAQVAPAAACIAPRHDPATGAALLALQALTTQQTG